MNSILEIEDAMADIIESPNYPAIRQEYERMLSIMGNVDGEEILVLGLVANCNVGKV